MTRFYSPRRLPELGTVSTVCGGERGSRKARSETDGGLPLASSLFPAIYGIIPSIPELVLLRLWGFFFFFFWLFVACFVSFVAFSRTGGAGSGGISLSLFLTMVLLFLGRNYDERSVTGT